MQLTSFLENNRLTIALTGEIDHHRAKHYIDTAEVPLSIHAGIYLKWQNALASYYKATDEKAHQKVARKRAQRALDVIREEIEESFDD